MSRSGYSDDLDHWSLICWRGAVKSAIRGKRGQAFLREALTALDALPDAALIPNNLAAEGAFCTLGAVGDDPSPHPLPARTSKTTCPALFDIPHSLACEIMFENDEGSLYRETPRGRATSPLIRRSPKEQKHERRSRSRRSRGWPVRLQPD